ncbi:MAG: hypothetical protein M3O68_08840 [Thermoproteota archaeon]|nr:hypothetical protein [Thermoproteota archaeon]
MLTRTGYEVDNKTKVSRRWLKMRKSRFSTEEHEDPEIQAEINCIILLSAFSKSLPANSKYLCK